MQFVARITSAQPVQKADAEVYMRMRQGLWIQPPAILQLPRLLGGLVRRCALL